MAIGFCRSDGTVRAGKAPTGNDDWMNDEMIISVDSQGRPELRDAPNFRAFKLIAASRPALALLKGGSGGVQVADDDIAWVQQDWILNQSGLAASAEWKSGFDKMVAFAASKGWIRASDNAIRAHIEYAE